MLNPLPHSFFSPFLFPFCVRKYDTVFFTQFDAITLKKNQTTTSFVLSETNLSMISMCAPFSLLSSQPLWQKIIFICFSPSVFSLPARVSFILKVFLHFWYKNGITQNFSEVWNVGKIPQNLLYMFFKCWLPDLFVKDYVFYRFLCIFILNSAI